MREYIAVAATFLLIIAMLLGYLLYTHNEQRKAYYACLEIVEKLSKEQNKSDSGVRIVSLPHCRL
jgi:hypothetical protein